MGFLEKEGESQSPLWDWVIGIGLLVLVGGFTFYYQFQKRTSLSSFSQADSLFQVGEFRSAESQYEALKSAQYLTPLHDSLIYARLDSIESMEEADAQAFARIRSRLAAGDTLGAVEDLDAFPFRGLLKTDEREFLQTLKSDLPSPTPASDSAAVE
jgi:hypothetical protein